MDFLTGFLLGRSSDNSGEVGILGVVGGSVFAYYFLKLYADKFHEHFFADKTVEFIIIYILLTILIYRYQYGADWHTTRGFIGMALKGISIGLSIFFGYSLFTTLGGTPFSWIIEYIQPLSWDSFILTELIGWIVWGALKISHMVCLFSGLYLIQTIIVNIGLTVRHPL